MHTIILRKLSFISLLVALQPGNGFAACTYNEAIMAMDRGNSVRAMALMNMAAKDGDQRAELMLARWQKKSVLAKNRSQTNIKELEKTDYQRLVMDTATQSSVGTN